MKVIILFLNIINIIIKYINIWYIIIIMKI
jgi:hypothetical protein